MVLFTEPDWTKFLAELIRFIKYCPPLEYTTSGPTLAIYVDAVVGMLGFSNHDGTRTRSAKVMVSKDDSIIFFEMYAITTAVTSVNLPCQLVVYSDSQACIESFRTGKAENDSCLFFLHKTVQHCAKFGISLILRYVRSEDNPADAPSRAGKEGGDLS